MLEQLDRDAVAKRVGLRVGTLDSYKRDGRMPKPDGYVGRSPWWTPATIDAWNASRRVGPGKPRGSKNRPKAGK